MQPITYSFAINLSALLAAVFLSWQFTAPYIFVIALLVQTHALERFRDEEREDDRDTPDDEPAIGFTADIKGK